MSGPFRAVDGDFDHGTAPRHTEEQIVGIEELQRRFAALGKSPGWASPRGIEFATPELVSEIEVLLSRIEAADANDQAD